jgi:TetR/AcrR family transcriptional repressor of nem operon
VITTVPGPQKQFDRSVVLEEAMNVFWTQGFEATSVDDLETAMGIGRSSMYGTFGGKRELFHEALKHYIDGGVAMITDVLTKGSDSPLKRLHAFFDMIEQRCAESAGMGCLCGNAAAEFGMADPLVSKIIQSFMQALENVLKDTVVAAVAKGELHKKTNSTKVARFIVVHMQGGQLMTKTSGGSDYLDGIAAQLKVLVESDAWRV